MSDRPAPVPAFTSVSAGETRPVPNPRPIPKALFLEPTPALPKTKTAEESR